jgi:hypothetical protein
MQRLFSMFPPGVAGAGLLILRVCSASVLLLEAPIHPLDGKSLWLLLLFLLISGTLCVGLLTPYVAAIGCLIELSGLWLPSTQPGFHFLIAALNIASVGMLGPGAYSLDARLFGRKVLNFSADRNQVDHR